MTAPEAGPLEAAARALRLAISPEPEAWHETANFQAGARAAIVAYLRARADQVAAMPPHGNRGWFVEQIRHDAAELEPAPAEPAKCQPVWGSCHLQAGHKGPHNAYAQPAERIDELEE